jgi:hypothetical protein
MKIFNFRKKKFETVINKDPKIVYGGIDQYGRYLYMIMQKDVPKPVHIIVLPEYIPATTLIHKDVKKREKILKNSTERKKKWNNYQKSVDETQKVMNPSEAVK